MSASFFFGAKTNFKPKLYDAPRNEMVYDRIFGSFMVSVCDYCSVRVLHTMNVSMQAK